VRWT